MSFRLLLTLGGKTETYEVDGELTESLDFWDADPSARVFSFATRLDAFDLPALLAAGITPDMAYARLYRDGELVLSGRVEDPRWRSTNDARMRIVEDLWADPVRFPPSYDFTYVALDQDRTTALQDAINAGAQGITDAVEDGIEGAQYFPPPVVGATVTFTATAEKTEGRVYPVVFGHPGADGDDQWPGSPALFVDTGSGVEKLLVCLGRTEAEYVRLYGKDTDGEWIEADVAVQPGVDALGRVVSVVVSPGIWADKGFGGGTDFVRDPENDFFVSWYDATSSLKPVNGLPGGLGNVIRFCLGQTRLRIDHARLTSSLARLNRYRFDGYIDEQVDLMEWLLDQLEPYPVRLCAGRNGIWAWQYDPDETPVAHVKIGVNASPDGDLRLTERDPISRYEIRYRHNDRARELTRIAYPDSLHAELGRQNGGRVVQVESSTIVDATTAEVCSLLQLRSRSNRGIVVSVVCAWEELGHLQIGDPVHFTWSKEGIEGKRAVITSIMDTGDESFSMEITVPIDPATWVTHDTVAEAETRFAPTSTDFPGTAWGIWNPMAATPGTVTPSVSYGSLLDQSGNARHGTPTGADPVATAASYVGPFGARAVPIPTSTYHRYDTGSDGTIGSFTLVSALPLDNGTWGNGKRPAAVYNPAQNISLRLVTGGDWNIVMGSTTIWTPTNTSGTDFAGLSTSSYAVTLISRQINIAETEAVWRCIIVRDPGDGTGPAIIYSGTLTGETASLALNNEKFRGIQYDNSPGRCGPTALYKSALSEAAAEAAVVAAGWYMGGSLAALQALF